VALLLDEPAADVVEHLLRDPTEPAILTAANQAEIVDVLVRLRGRPYEDVVERLEWLVAAGLEVLAVTGELSLAAGRMRADHYHRTERPVSLADCFALAAASGRGEALATSDPPLITVAGRVGVRIVALPDSTGRRHR
jgi:uncharacterized protein with PIN domain